MNYIDAEKLIAKIRRIVEEETPISKGSDYYHGVADTADKLLSIISSLQQEHLEDIVITAKTFLDALSKTPYNNKPITDAQIIVRQLLLFFENQKEYNPDAILEQPGVDLEKEVEFICINKRVKMTIQELINYYIDTECAETAIECGF